MGAFQLSRVDVDSSDGNYLLTYRDFGDNSVHLCKSSDPTGGSADPAQWTCWSGASALEHAPKVAVAPGMGYAVTWVDDASMVDYVKTQVLDTSLTPVFSAAVNTTTSACSDPDVAFQDDGTNEQFLYSLICRTGSMGGVREVWGRRLWDNAGTWEWRDSGEFAILDENTEGGGPYNLPKSDPFEGGTGTGQLECPSPDNGASGICYQVSFMDVNDTGLFNGRLVAFNGATPALSTNGTPQFNLTYSDPSLALLPPASAIYTLSPSYIAFAWSSQEGGSFDEIMSDFWTGQAGSSLSAATLVERFRVVAYEDGVRATWFSLDEATLVAYELERRVDEAAAWDIVVDGSVVTEGEEVEYALSDHPDSTPLVDLEYRLIGVNTEGVRSVIAGPVRVSLEEGPEGCACTLRRSGGSSGATPVGMGLLVLGAFVLGVRRKRQIR